MKLWSIITYFDKNGNNDIKFSNHRAIKKLRKKNSSYISRFTINRWNNEDNHTKNLIRNIK